MAHQASCCVACPARKLTRSAVHARRIEHNSMSPQRLSAIMSVLLLAACCCTVPKKVAGVGVGVGVALPAAMATRLFYAVCVGGTCGSAAAK